jgi:cystathionine gamma-lyase
MSKKKSLATRVIFAGQHVDPVTGALMTPIFANSTFRQEAPGVHNGMEYGRANNPTRNAFEACVADLEGGVDGFAFASGMAAIDCVLHTLKAGDHVLAMDDLYGGSRRLFEKVYRPHSMDWTSPTMTLPPTRRSKVWLNRIPNYYGWKRRQTRCSRSST